MTIIAPHNTGDRTQFARLTRLPEACYSDPIRIPVGGGFTTELPKGEGLILKQWDQAAYDIEQAVLKAGNGLCLTLYQLDERRYSWIGLRAAGELFPATTLFTHPGLVHMVRTELEAHLDGPIAVYIKGDNVQACPFPMAVKRKEWHGPFDLRNGFCVPLNLG